MNAFGLRALGVQYVAVAFGLEFICHLYNDKRAYPHKSNCLANYAEPIDMKHMFAGD
jgi:hypothetical protein